MHDVIIIGGGPGGSAMGSYLSKAGIDNVIFESANHPRPHVGESLVPSSNQVFEEIGFIETMEREGFVKKIGAAWHQKEMGGMQEIYFRDFQLPGVNQDYTYHVNRAKFDLLMLKHAESLGSKVYQGVRVKEVLFEDGAACGVRVDIAGQTVDVRSKLVVDASGRRTLLGRQLGWLQKDPLFNQYVIHGWFKNVDRSQVADLADVIHIYFMSVDRGWVWQIPIDDEITSIGVVAEKHVFMDSKEDQAGWFYRMVEATPKVAAALRNAEQVTEFRAEGDYSYAMKNYCGEGFLLVGDAARFVDPIFSSGVSVALHSAKFGSQVIQRCMESGDFSAEALRPYETRLRSGTEVWYEFIVYYYKLLPLFSYFIAKEDHKLEIIRLLSGDVFDRSEVPVLDAMRRFIEVVEKSETHLLRSALDGSLEIDDFMKVANLAQ